MMPTLPSDDCTLRMDRPTERAERSGLGAGIIITMGLAFVAFLAFDSWILRAGFLLLAAVGVTHLARRMSKPTQVRVELCGTRTEFHW